MISLPLLDRLWLWRNRDLSASERNSSFCDNFRGIRRSAVSLNLGFGRSRFLVATRAHVPHFLAWLSQGGPSERALLTLSRNDTSQGYGHYRHRHITAGRAVPQDPISPKIFAVRDTNLQSNVDRTANFYEYSYRYL